MPRLTLKNILSVLLGTLTLWLLWPGSAAVSHWQGAPAAQAPVQKSENLPQPWDSSGYRITPLASYQVKAVVLSRENYRWDRPSDLSPTDLALGWGRMSEEAVVKAMDISQSGRWYHYQSSETPPISQAQIIRSSSNHHLIPAGEDVRKTLANVKVHSLVELEGYLVEVTHRDGWKWKSSLTREDTGDGSCEILWVERATVTKP